MTTDQATEDRTAAEGAAAAGPSWRWWLGTAAAVFLGAIYLVAVYAKAIAPGAFVTQIETEGLDFLVPAVAVAFVALAVEAAVGVALLANLRRLWVLVPTALLTLFFLGLNTRAWWLDARGLREDAAGCGCFGNLVDRTPAEALVQDLLILGVPTLLVFLGRPRVGRRFPPLRTALVLLAALAVPLFAWKAPELPLDDLATRLKPGVEIAALCSGREDTRICLDTLVPELTVGEHLVVLTTLDDETFLAAVDRFSDYALAAGTAAAEGDGAPPLWVLAPGTEEEHRAFFWSHGPAFELREVPQTVLAPLYRRLPRSFRVEGGTVTETWSGLPPLPESTTTTTTTTTSR